MYFLTREQLRFKFHYKAVLILNYFLKHARLATLRLTAAEAVRILSLEQYVVNPAIVRCSFVTL